jgi:hypothetical protein
MSAPFGLSAPIQLSHLGALCDQLENASPPGRPAAASAAAAFGRELRPDQLNLGRFRRLTARS